MENKFEDKRFMKIFGIYFCILVAFVGIRIASGYGMFDQLKDEITVDIVSTLIIQVGIMFLLPFCLYMALFSRNAKQTFSDFKYKRIGIKSLLICLLLGILGYIINIYAATFFSVILERIGYHYSSSGSGIDYDTWQKYLVGIASVALLPALCEEFLHRGLLLHGTRKVWGVKTAIIVSSICFGLMHLNIQQFFFAMVLGIFMAYADFAAGSIIPSIIMHFFNNFINVTSSFLHDAGIMNFSLSSLLNAIYNFNPFVFVLFVGVVLVVTLLAFIYLTKKLFKLSVERENKKISKFNKINSEIIYDTQTGVVSQGKVTIQINNQGIIPNNIESLNSNANIDWIDEWNTSEAHNKNKVKLSFMDKIPFILCIFMATLITVFTFLWGVV